MAITVACLTRAAQCRYRRIAEAMAEGIAKCGDIPFILEMGSPRIDATVAVSFGWKHHRYLEEYPQFVYADLGYWERDRYYRLSVGDWSPHRYVRAGLPMDRLRTFGLVPKPWRTSGTEIVVAGSTMKAAADHGMEYMAWERQAVERLRDCGVPVVYRPKPSDADAVPIDGVPFDRRPIGEALGSAWGWVTHHSNSAVDALLAGVPVHCETGAAAAFSVPLETMASPELLGGRRQFLSDVAWLQWTLDEMRSGAAWMHLKELRLIV